MKLSDAVRAEGFAFRVLRRPNSVKGALGTGTPHQQARVYRCGSRLGIACKADSWEHCYSVSHEIAESRHGFRHTELMFCEQANLLARWHRLRP
jgi:hypothetical protein